MRHSFLCILLCTTNRVLAEKKEVKQMLTAGMELATQYLKYRNNVDSQDPYEKPQIQSVELLVQQLAQSDSLETIMETLKAAIPDAPLVKTFVKKIKGKGLHSRQNSRVSSSTVQKKGYFYTVAAFDLRFAVQMFKRALVALDSLKMAQFEKVELDREDAACEQQLPPDLFNSKFYSVKKSNINFQSQSILKKTQRQKRLKIEDVDPQIAAARECFGLLITQNGKISSYIRDLFLRLQHFAKGKADTYGWPLRATLPFDEQDALRKWWGWKPPTIFSDEVEVKQGDYKMQIAELRGPGRIIPPNQRTTRVWRLDDPSLKKPKLPNFGVKNPQPPTTRWKEGLLSD